MGLKEIKAAYASQRARAESRGIEWQFTYETWLTWWGDDIGRRGTGPLDLQMQRIADSGPYHPDNVRKGVPKQNSATTQRMRLHKESRQARADILRREMAAPSDVMEGKFLDIMSDDEVEIARMMLPGKASWL